MVEPTQSRPNAAGQRPSVRARALKETLAFLDEYRPELARMVEVDAPSDTLCAIREALPVDWISAELSRGLIEVIVDELGAHDGLNVWRDLVTYRLRHSSVIGPLISLATTVGFAAPWSFAKQVPRGWENTYKDYGSPRASRARAQAEGGARVGRGDEKNERRDRGRQDKWPSGSASSSGDLSREGCTQGQK